MSRIAINISLALAIIIICGCASRRQCPPLACPQYVSARINVAVSPKSDEGVSSDFGAIPKYESVKRSLFDQTTSGEIVSIDLQEVICLAARNSELADLIESERHVLRCKSDRISSSLGTTSGCNDSNCDDPNCNQPNRAADLVLQGEALEQRNIAAGAAAELFLRMVEVDLQRGLLEETKQHLLGLEETIAAADEEGFATADGKNELAEGQLKVKQSEAKLNSAEQKLLYNLNQLINIDANNSIRFRAVHTLRPQELPVDVAQQAAMAESNRPGIRAVELALTEGVCNRSINQLVRLLDSRLGLGSPPVSIRKTLLRRQLRELIERDTKPDPDSETRKGQLQQIVDARRNAARAEAHDALLGIQSSLEELSLVQENIERLDAKEKQLTAKQEIDAEASFLESNLNWIERQEAKSKRVSVAIEHEISMLKLFQAQGELVRECGFDLEPNIISNCSSE